MRQAQQNLQTGAINQQTAGAVAQQEQQKNQELQSLAQFTRSASQDPQYHNPDGSLNVEKFQTDASAAAPTYGQAYIGQATSNANASIDNRKALLSLSNEQRATAGQIFGGLAANPKATPQDLQDAVDQARNLSDDPGWHKAMDRVLFSHPNTANMPDAQASETVRQFARGVALQTGAKNAGQSDPAVSLVQTTAGQTPTNLNPQSPTGTGPVGKAIPLPPQPITLPAGQLGNRSAQTGAISLAPQEGASPATASGAASPPTGASPSQNLNPTRAQVDTQQGLAKGVTERVSQAQLAANNTTQAQDALTRARAILDNPEGPDTGSGFENKKAIMNFLSSAGIDTKGADDANTLAKNLARYEASRATQAGLGGTDAARELAHSGSPTVALDNKALKGVVTQSLATEKALAAYAGVQSQSQDPAVLAKNEKDFRNIPNLIEGYEYGLARNPKEADEFLTKHGVTRDQMTKTRQMIKEFEGRGQ